MRKIYVLVIALLLVSAFGLSKPLSVKADTGSFTYLTTTLSATTVDTPYSATINFIYSGKGLPTVTAIGLPAGIYIAPQGHPTITQNAGIDSLTLNGGASTEGNYSVVFAYNDQTDGATGTQTFPLVVKPLFNIDGYGNVNGSALTNGTTGAPYNFQFSVQYLGGMGTLTSNITGLPLGITATPIYQQYPSSENYIIDLKGTPGEAGAYPVQLTLSDYLTTQTFPLTLAVYQAQATSPTSPIVSPSQPVTTPATNNTDAIGTNILTPDGTVSMIASDGTRRPYTSAGAFLSYGFNSWSSVVTASTADTALAIGSFIPPRDGKIICSNKGSDIGTCYLITNSQKAGFTSATVFKGLGFSFSNTSAGDVSWMTSTSPIASSTNAHLPGTLINNNGTYELVTTSGFIGIPNALVLQSWGYSFSDAVPANNADKTLSQTGVLPTKQTGQLAPQ